MPADLQALAAAAVALPGWKWARGMQAIITVDGVESCWAVTDPAHVPRSAVLHLADPATGGAMLELLAGSGRHISVSQCGEWWSLSVMLPYVSIETTGLSLGEAVARVAIDWGRWA